MIYPLGLTINTGEKMNRTFVTILMAAAGLGFSVASSAAINEAKANYNAARDAATADYKEARARCDSLGRNLKNVCIEEANVRQTRAKAEAEARYKDTPKARVNARKAVADAEFALAKTRCGSLVDNPRNVCIKEAKAAQIAAIADARADGKVTAARSEARDEKREAEYKVELEKCDALASAAKDACVSSAKALFRK
jgi:hypothetical protein